MRWDRGRQETGYLKKTLYTFRLGRFGTDAYLLKFPEGCDVPTHTDPVDDSRHYRLNVVLQHAESGGEFVCDDPIVDLPRIKVFRPDKNLHSVRRIEKGTRFVLSLGLALQNGNAG